MSTPPFHNRPILVPILVLAAFLAFVPGSAEASDPAIDADRSDAAVTADRSDAAITADRSDAAITAARAWRAAHGPEIVRDFAKLLEIPNVARDTENIRRNAEVIRDLLAERGVEAELWTLPQYPAAPPIVYGRLPADGPAPEQWNAAHPGHLRPLRRPAGGRRPLDRHRAVEAAALHRRRSRRAARRSTCPPTARRSTRSGGSTPAAPATTRRRSRPSWPPSTPWRRPACPGPPTWSSSSRARRRRGRPTWRSTCAPTGRSWRSTPG